MSVSSMSLTFGGHQLFCLCPSFIKIKKLKLKLKSLIFNLIYQLLVLFRLSRLIRLGGLQS